MRTYFMEGPLIITYEMRGVHRRRDGIDIGGHRIGRFRRACGGNVRTRLSCDGHAAFDVFRWRRKCR